MTQALLQPLPDERTKGKPLVHTLAATPRRPMRVVIAGECNSGKTWLANGLLGSQVLPTSFVTRTELPTVVEFGASSRLVLERHDGSRVATTWEDAESGASQGRRLYCRLPSSRLKGFRLVDMPGLGDGDEGKLRRDSEPLPHRRPRDLVHVGAAGVEGQRAGLLDVAAAVGARQGRARAHVRRYAAPGSGRDAGAGSPAKRSWAAFPEDRRAGATPRTLGHCRIRAHRPLSAGAGCGCIVSVACFS